MIHKFQNIHGICYSVPAELKEYKKHFENLFLDIDKDKKAPFSDVYVKVPIHMFSKFCDVMRDCGMNYKEITSNKWLFLLKF